MTLPVEMQAHGLGPEADGLAISLNAILIALLSAPASNLLVRWPRFGSMAASALLLGAESGLTAIATTLPLYGVAVAVWTLGELLRATIAPTIVADLSPVDLRGLDQGVFGAAWGLSAFIDPSMGGWVFQHLGADVLWVACLALGCVLALGFLGIARPASKRLPGRGPT